jgi:hypothetical protein
MDSPRFDAAEIVACFQEAARRGDWTSAESLAITLQAQSAPTDRNEVEEYLLSLKTALIVAKASRADTSATLGRLRAALSFGSCQDAAARRQNPGDPTES